MGPQLPCAQFPQQSLCWRICEPEESSHLRHNAESLEEWLQMPRMITLSSVQKRADSGWRANNGTTIIHNARNHSPNDKPSHRRRPESFSEMLVTMNKTTQITIFEMQMLYPLKVQWQLTSLMTLMFFWPSIVIYQYGRTNKMHHLLSVYYD
jgi:hypothetical protein